MAKTKKEGKSPYFKYHKTPWRYSDNLLHWTAAVKAGDKPAIEKYDALWKAAHDVVCEDKRDDYLEGYDD